MIIIRVLYDFQRKDPCIYSSELSGEIRALHGWRQGITANYISPLQGVCTIQEVDLEEALYGMPVTVDESFK